MEEFRGVSGEVPAPRSGGVGLPAPKRRSFNGFLQLKDPIYVGLAVTCLVLGLIGSRALLIAVPFAGYGFAWAAHIVVEHNKPATFIYPWWSFVSDLRMFALFVTGRLGPHLIRAGVSN